MTEQIFISYSKKDSTFAHKLADDLIAAGFKIWIDRSIGGGELWRETIEKNLKASGDVIIVVSPNSMASEWVKHEGSLAYGWGKRLFPILIEPVKSLPPWLEEYQWIDFVNKTHEAAFNVLAATLTPPNPIQDLLDQQVQVCRQTGDLIGEAILRVVNENRGVLAVDDQAQELIARSQQVIDERVQRERQLIAEKEEARRSELQKAEQIQQLELFVARKKAEEAEEQRRLEQIRALKAENEARKASRRSKILRNALVISASLLVITVIGFAWFIRSHPKPLTGNINIAIAEFSVIDQNGIDVSKKYGSIGKTIAESIANSLEHQIVEGNHPNVTIEMAYPNTVGVIEGKDQDERTMNAIRVAERLNANIVIYGNITLSDTFIRIDPEFYYRSSVGKESGELRLFQLAINSLDSHLMFPSSPPYSSVTIDNLLLAPAINISVAEVYYTLGYFQQAIDSLQLAADSVELGNGYGSVSYIEALLGNIYVDLSEQEFSEDTIQTAQAHFRKALELAPDNSWAIIGFGDINYIEALKHWNDNSDIESNLALVEQAEAAYQKALALPHSPDEYLTVKAFFGQGQVYLVEGLMTKDPTDQNIMQAKNIFEEIISDNRKGKGSIQDLACEANARLGEIAIFQGKTDDAVNNYKTAISLCYFGFCKAYYSGVLGDLYVDAGRMEDAIVAYTNARDIGAADGNVSIYNRYQDKLNSLTCICK